VKPMACGRNALCRVCTLSEQSYAGTHVCGVDVGAGATAVEVGAPKVGVAVAPPVVCAEMTEAKVATKPSVARTGRRVSWNRIALRKAVWTEGFESRLRRRNG